VCKVPRHDGVRTDRYKLVNYYTNGEQELFDLEDDPLETKLEASVDGERIVFDLKATAGYGHASTTQSPVTFKLEAGAHVITLTPVKEGWSPVNLGKVTLITFL
jgi:hypothetical protein